MMPSVFFIIVNDNHVVGVILSKGNVWIIEVRNSKKVMPDVLGHLICIEGSTRACLVHVRMIKARLLECVSQDQF